MTLAIIFNPTSGARFPLRASGERPVRKGFTKLSRKILVVEDHADTRELLARLLELENFNVVTATDGATALKAVEFEDPDLVVTDISMPNLDGIQMIKTLRSNAKYERLPIVTLTAYGQGIAGEALTAGADRAFAKPLEFDQLVSSIKHLIAPKASMATTAD
jgi:CheY-like chemotaxis protein